MLILSGVGMFLAVYVSEIKKAKLALYESNEKLSSLLNSMAEGSYGIDTNGDCTFAENLGNGAIAKLRFLVPDSRSAGRVFAAKRRKPARHRDTALSHARAYVSTPCWVGTR